MLNALHPAYLAKVMAAQLNARFDKKGEKAAMIFVSSAASFMPTAGNLIYSATEVSPPTLEKVSSTSLKVKSMS